VDGGLTVIHALDTEPAETPWWIYLPADLEDLRPAVQNLCAGRDHGRCSRTRRISITHEMIDEAVLAKVP